MTLQNFELTDNNHFIALERRRLFFKGIYLVLITSNYLVGLQLNNSLSTESTETLFAPETQPSPKPRGSFNNPYSYLKEKQVRAIEKKYLYDLGIFGVNKYNFRIDRNEVKSVLADTKKVSWLRHPHDGTVYITTRQAKPNPSINKSLNIDRKELIVLGDQSAKDIAKWILTR